MMLKLLFPLSLLTFVYSQPLSPTQMQLQQALQALQTQASMPVSPPQPMGLNALNGLNGLGLNGLNLQTLANPLAGLQTNPLAGLQTNTAAGLNGISGLNGLSGLNAPVGGLGGLGTTQQFNFMTPQQFAALYPQYAASLQNTLLQSGLSSPVLSAHNPFSTVTPHTTNGLSGLDMSHLTHLNGLSTNNLVTNQASVPAAFSGLHQQLQQMIASQMVGGYSPGLSQGLTTNPLAGLAANPLAGLQNQAETVSPQPFTAPAPEPPTAPGA